MAAYGAYGYLVVGLLVIGFVGVIASVIEQRHRNNAVRERASIVTEELASNSK